MTERRSTLVVVASLITGLLSALAGTAKATILVAPLYCDDPRAGDCRPAAALYGKDEAFQQRHAEADAPISLPQAMLVGNASLLTSLYEESIRTLSSRKEASEPAGAPAGVLPAALSSVTGMVASGYSFTAKAIAVDVRRLQFAAGPPEEQGGLQGFALLAILSAGLATVAIAARRWTRNASRRRIRRTVAQSPLRPLRAT